MGSANLSKMIVSGDHDVKNPVTTLASHDSPSARGFVGNTHESENLVAFDCAYLQGVRDHILATAWSLCRCKPSLHEWESATAMYLASAFHAYVQRAIEG